MNTFSRSTGSLFSLLLLFLFACSDSDPVSTSPSEVDPPTFSVAAQEDVEALIGESMAGWWRGVYGPGPGPALVAAADGHISFARNWGVMFASLEPREDLSALEEQFREFLSDVPWTELYRTLVSVRDGMIVLAAGYELGDGESDTRRALAFGSFMQGLALGTLAQLFDEAWIVDETADLSAMSLSSYDQVMEAALAKLDRTVELAGGGDFTIPAEWVAFYEPMDQDRLARLARSFQARFRISAARSPVERESVDWGRVLADVRAGITREWGGWYDGDFETNWAWQLNKLLGGSPYWFRMDHATVGPADSGGEWQAWLAEDPEDRLPFLIDTDDARITGGSPTSDGTYVRYQENIVGPPSRGTYRWAHYSHGRFSHLFAAEAGGFYVDFTMKELAFIEAEALFRLGDREGAMAIVNESRASGILPLFTDPDGTAPGGDRCVPKRPDGSCGNLWDALRYEKRLELLHHTAFGEYTDARGWGTLQEGTFTSLPRPQVSLPQLLAEFYGASSPAEALGMSNAIGEEELELKRQGITRFDRERNRNPGNVGAS